MKKISSIMAALTLLAIAGTAALTAGCKHAEADEHGGMARQYTCKMHPEVVQDSPGTCPKCGMKLTRKE